MKKISVSIADDHPVVLSGLRNIVSEWSNVVILDTCSNGADLLKCLKVRQPDVLLLDIHMPGVHGHELAAVIVQEHPTVRILTLTNIDATFQVKNMMEHGAMGYLLKSAEPAVLLHAIETVHQGKQYVDATLKEDLFKEMLQSRNTSTPELTIREKDILRLIAGEFTSQEISEKLSLSHRTIENHRLNLLLKLGVKNTAGLVRKAIQLKLVD